MAFSPLFFVLFLVHGDPSHLSANHKPPAHWFLKIPPDMERRASYPGQKQTWDEASGNHVRRHGPE